MSRALPLSASDSHRLSKSKFLAGLQCHKRLYLDIHTPELATPPDEATQAILDMGTDVGVLARRRFPGGILVETDHRHAADALRRTAELIGLPSVPAIFEGAFQWDGVLVRVDVLERVAGQGGESIGWSLIEVKSSTRVKDVHLDDLAIQFVVLKGAGLPLVRAGLLHVNTQYVYPGGDVDVTQLFTLADVTDPVMTKCGAVQERLTAMKQMLAQPGPPAIEPDGHCHTPYECPYWAHCTREKPARWIFHLPGGDRTYRALADKGIHTIDEIPDTITLSPAQRRMKDNREWVSAGLSDAMRAIRYPVHHLDFETFMPAVPRFPKTRPYETIPTQWSNHIEFEDGTVHHEAYLCGDPVDPREDLTTALLKSVGETGSICVYSGYERSVLERLAETRPSVRAQLKQVIARLWDLYEVIKGHYYHPGFRGSYSIKDVLPAVVPTLHYDDLEIQDGSLAARAYYRMVFEESDWVERLRIRDALLQYCMRDTQAMLEIRRALREKAKTA